MSEEKKNDGIKRDFDGIKFFVTEAGKYRKKDPVTKQEVGPELDSPAGIKIFDQNWNYVSVSPLFVASLYQALVHDKELREELEKRLAAQKEEIKKLLLAEF